MKEEDMTYESLGKLDSYDKIKKTSYKMKYGDVVGMTNWCKSQGPVDPPWFIRRVFGVPLPWFTVLVIIGVIVSSASGIHIGSTVIVGLSLIVLILLSGLLFAQYKYNRRGTCHFCGGPSNATDRIKVMSSKGKEKKHSDSGYCTTCHNNVQRYQNWSTVRHQRWLLIEQNPVSKRIPIITWLLDITPFYTMKYTDPCAVSMGFTYTKRDQKFPRDVFNEDIIKQLQNQCLLMHDNLEQLKNAKRFKI